MIRKTYSAIICILSILMIASTAQASVQVSGDLKLWHKVTLTIDGPQASETADPNPFLFYRLNVTFKHKATGKTYVVPGYYAADGRAGETSAESGNKWRVHFSPDETGIWIYGVSLRKGENIAVSDEVTAGKSTEGDGSAGSFTIFQSDKTAPDFRAKGALRYVGSHHLQFAGSKEYFLKAGPDSPETLFAYADFDGTYTLKTPLKQFRPHLSDWKPGDPTWKGGKGRGLIGAFNYLSGKGVNTVSFLTYNAGGDGSNIWPFIKHDEKLRYDCSKLDQWQKVFDHAQAKGIHLHFKTQETENDDNVPESLDGGELGIERKLYYRELIARFGYILALSWNLGEENSQTPAQQKAMSSYLITHDPYKHNVTLHTYPGHIDKIYNALLGAQSQLTGISMQNDWSQTHGKTLQWIRASQQAGRPWVVANDEQNQAGEGVPPDPGYSGFNADSLHYNVNDIRKSTLWGNLMAGGSGVEYYFGYGLPENDLFCEDWRSRDKSWEYAGIALEFFQKQRVPFWEMHCNDQLTADENDYCFLKDGEIYLIYQKQGGPVTLNFSKGEFVTGWFNPRTGEGMDNLLQTKPITGPTATVLTAPDDNDWLLVIRSRDGGRVLSPLSTLTLSATRDFQISSTDDLVPAYADSGRGALAIDAAQFKDRFAGAEFSFDGPADKYHITLTTLTEKDGESTYKLLVNGKEKASFQNPATVEDYAPAVKRWENIELTKGDTIQVRFNTASNMKIAEGSGTAYSRGRWTTLRLDSVSGKEIPTPTSQAQSPDQPKPKAVMLIDTLYNGQVFEERDGLLVAEAEHFAKQELTEIRRWYITTKDAVPGIQPDGDESHADTASGGAYIELLPDTRRTHSDELITGINFSNEPGLMAILSYPVYINNPGRYYVWVRACFTGSEDNGIHVGIDGAWPESGRRMQWCEGGGAWWWESKQRTEQQHCGEPYLIYLDIDKPGEHTIQFSLREDGFEFDKFLLTKEREFPRPTGPGPAETIR